MTTTSTTVNGEQENSQERGLNSERLKRVQTFIQDVLKPVDATLGEHAAQQEEVKKFESRPYQLEAWDALWQSREEGGDRGLIHLATGLGKTSVAVFDYAKFRKEQEAKGETARALFVVHQNAILEQADERFNEVLPHLLPGVGMSRFSNQSDGLPIGEVTFASFQALDRGAYKIPSDYFDYIVYDEVHHMEAETYKKVVEHFTPKFQLGLTATPERGDGKKITDHFGEALYSKTLPEGIAEKYLADVHYHLMLDEQTKELLQGGFKPKNMTELNKMFDFEPNLSDIAEAIQATQQEIRDATGLEKVKTIIFDSDLYSADEMAKLMNGESYHSARNEKDQKRVLQAFRDSSLETIVTRDMFNEGVDIPDARLIVFLRSTQSKTIFEQQLGRGLRKTDEKDDVVVLDFVANAERIRLVRELAHDVQSKRVGIGDETGGGNGTEKGVAIGAGKSDFEFDSQIIDILALYDYFREQAESKVDWSTWDNESIVALAKRLSPDTLLTQTAINELSKNDEFPSFHEIKIRFGDLINEFHRACGFEFVEAPEGVLSLENFANKLDIHSNTVKNRIERLGISVDDLPIYTFNGYRARGISLEIQEAVANIEGDTTGIKPFFELIKELGIHKGIASQYVKQYMPTLEKFKFGNIESYGFTPEDVQTFLSIPEVSKLVSLEYAPEDARTIPDFATDLGTSRYIFIKFLESHNIEAVEYRIGGRSMRFVTAEQQDAIRKVWV